RRAHRHFAHPRAQLGADGWRRRLFENLLVPPLDGAVTPTQPDAVAVLVGQNLHLDVPRSVDGPLQVHGSVAERRAGFAHRLAESSLEACRVGDHAQALATAPSDSLQRYRETDVRRRAPDLVDR